LIIFKVVILFEKCYLGLACFYWHGDDVAIKKKKTIASCTSTFVSCT